MTIPAPTVVTGIAELRARVRDHRAARTAAGEAPVVVLVPTMGALHEGHLAHARRARELGSLVVVSIFVNPLQFGAGEDLDAYPRTLDADVAALAETGVDLVFAPPAAEMYPDGPARVRVTGGSVALTLEGRSRPGHFDGMLTVVAKLLHIVAPDVATFGQKDAQQLHLVRRMVRDLDLPVRIEELPTVREPDGLALSSRNRYLDERERRAARVIPAALEAAQSAGDRGVDAVIAAAQSVVMGEPAVALDHFQVVDPTTFESVDDGFTGVALAVIAAHVGSTRLIDNATVVIA
ncbi:pantoate--beta-alanine ligase [Clavibacter nebraskensis]|uniref:Pantothenate synthetase n=2 Tax=Clavibacter nebraskensis TaxID=31963 RepID=A0A399PYT9_9MICO|nr:pantoate--beta-alanine ligase [Clavibacter nebraskensis]KXU21409.1 pantoate--beta-alanine ligase [Clavibacter nebraskensis]OAH20123.1 pantoate--beta-alanine ligase [Clavibacter nebraskensis]QGV66067.1 pantoate--beta-alanine ligase [Clavibacter nebraskensis]QGV68865.1 pantoate--beta-alanine ligase [Clavibacter nebraskensis]QGV71655.1 pantoate--beta-alanine ligase [Clavibacter nebraskensis]